jgi:hypothetical protein
MINLQIKNGELLTPGKGKILPTDQTVTWNLISDGSASFNDPPVSFPNPPPPPPPVYTAWPGSDPEPAPPNRWQADTNRILPPGSPAQLYKYTVHWSGGDLDPELENQPGSGSGGSKRGPEDQGRGDRDRGPGNA